MRNIPSGGAAAKASMKITKLGGKPKREVKPSKRTRAHEINLKQAAPAEDSSQSTSSAPKFGQRLASNGITWLEPRPLLPVR